VNKIDIRNHATEPYNRASIFKAFFKIETSINRVADGYIFPIKAVTTNYTMTLGDTVILADATGGNITVTLKPALECTEKLVIVKRQNGGANTVTIDADGTETIDGSTTNVLNAQYDTVRLMAYGGSWWIV
jgi:hypothetical protein